MPLGRNDSERPRRSVPIVRLKPGVSASAAQSQVQTFHEALAKTGEGYRVALNGRFKGGFITRHYGHPVNGVHAVQLELSEVNYMDEKAPYRFVESKARQLRPQLRTLLDLFLLIGGKAAPR